MNFKDKEVLVSKYLDKIYSNMLDDFASCNKYEIIKTGFYIEYQKLCNYSVAIKNELKNELSDELGNGNYPNPEIILSRFDDLAKGFKLPNVQINEDTFVETVIVEDTYSKSYAKDRNNGTSYIIVGSGAGAIVGAGIGFLIGKAAVPLLVGSLIGGLVGGTAGYHFTNSTKERTEYKDEVQSARKTIKRIDKNKLESFTLERKNIVKDLFMNYLNNFENIYSQISMR